MPDSPLIMIDASDGATRLTISRICLVLRPQQPFHWSRAQLLGHPRYCTDQGWPRRASAGSQSLRLASPQLLVRHLRVQSSCTKGIDGYFSRVAFRSSFPSMPSIWTSLTIHQCLGASTEAALYHCMPQRPESRQLREYQAAPSEVWIVFNN